MFFFLDVAESNEMVLLQRRARAASLIPRGPTHLLALLLCSSPTLNLLKEARGIAVWFGNGAAGAVRKREGGCQAHCSRLILLREQVVVVVQRQAVPPPDLREHLEP